MMSKTTETRSHDEMVGTSNGPVIPDASATVRIVYDPT